MQTRLRQIILCLCALVVLSLSSNSTTAQVVQQAPLPSPTVQPSPSPSPSPEARPLYGVQGVLVETLDGRVVSSQAVFETFNPASAIKLATALAALEALGPAHRFNTGVWTDGTLDRDSGTINGNLYISGMDPSFHYEHAIMVARQLNSLGIREVAGDLVVSPGFTMNFDSSSRRSGEQMYDTLDSTLRTTQAIRAWTYERSVLKDQASLQVNPSVAVLGEVLVAPVAPAAKLLVTQRSSKLVDILKVLLCYSNNFMAQRLGDNLGGTESVRQRLIKRLGVSPADLRLASLSGLGVNRVTPLVMMKILRGLRTELRKNGLSLSDVMPVAGIDPGTMEDRFTALAWKGSVIAKTGTLVRTDGGVSSLVGELRSANGEVLLFVIMNQRGSVWRFRENQDYFVMLIQNSRGGPRAFNYKPIPLAMQLLDTESTVAASEEYEPENKSPN
jgi:D-alanyl-D-alanine carboxypeptidase